MSDGAKKAVRGIATAAAVTGGLYLGVGAAICEAVLSRPAVNKEPDEMLANPEKLNYYYNHEHFRKADDWFFTTNPADTTMVNDKGVTLHCNIIENEKPTHKWAVVCHGYTSRPRWMAMQAKHYNEKGFNVLLPIMMAHRTDKRRHTSMGYYEHLDVVSWIEYIVAKDPEAEILVHGCSMGGAITMLVTGEKLPSNVKVAVEDCGYTSAWDEFSAQIGEIMHLPRFPFLYAANTISKYALKWDFRKCAPIEAVARSVTPTFFVHGMNDTFVPFEMLEKVYEACSAEKEMLEIPDAEHDMSCMLHPELYWPAIDKFTEKYI